MEKKEGFMKFSIEKNDAGISVRIDDVMGREQMIIEKIRQCRRSAWACPSAECQNIGAMEERAGEGSVFLTLTPAPGAQIDPRGIEECLRYMLHPAVKA